MSSDTPQIYDQDYRHFDLLIWQAPTWASAIFTFTMTTAGLLLANSKHVEGALKLDPLPTLAVFLLAVFVVLVLLANALVRFRLHQGSKLAPATKVDRPDWQPRGHTSLQLIIFVEASVLLVFGLYCAGLPLWLSNSLGVALLAVGFPVVERWVLRTIVVQRSRLTANISPS
jgi:cytochrome c biogenesis factor